VKGIITILLMAFGVYISLGNTPSDSLFQNGVSALQGQNYVAATNYFEELVLSGNDDGATFYNLGTAYLQLNKLGKARLMLERAKLRMPEHEATLINIEILKDRMETTVITLEPFFLVRWWRAFYNLLNPITWSILSGIGFLSTLFILHLIFFKSQNNRNHWLLAVSITMTLICIIAGSSRYSYLYNNETFVVQKRAIMYNQPSLDSPEMKNLSPGVKLTLKDQEGDWIKIMTDDLEEGWVLISNVEKI
jgi:tetratricopeptide (TPR) repeat protein